MDKDNKYRPHGFAGTIVFHAALLTLLFFLALTNIPQEEEGLLVNFGDGDTGMGAEEPKYNEPQAARPEETTPPPPVTAPSSQQKVEAEKVNTQDFEEAAALKKEEQRIKNEAEAKRKAEEKRAKEEKERQDKLAREEQERIRKEEEQKKKEAAEKARKAQEVSNNIAKGFAGKGTGNSTSEGEAGGEGNQGKLTGDPNSTNREGSGLGNKGHSFSLEGRSLKKEIPDPVYRINEEGTVVVDIVVDKYGKVTSARVRPKGTTIHNATLWKVAEEAALKARFSEKLSVATQTGTITYLFTLQ
jgi:TonB family protein